MTRLAALLILFAFPGCAVESPPEAEVKTAIAKYNVALVEAYRNLYFEPLERVALKKEIHRVDTIISGYLQGKRVMEPEPHGVVFEEIGIDGDRAAVRTSEDWSYRWVDIETEKPLTSLKEVHYNLLYTLVKEDGRWMVARVEDTDDRGEGERVDLPDEAFEGAP